MQRTATMLFAAVVGIHCADGADDTPIAAPPLADTEAQRPPVRHDVSMTLAEASPAPETSTAVADDGSYYVAGVFDDAFAVGPRVLRSRGANDVYLAHFLPDGRVDWAKAIGSKQNESAPHVRFDEGRVYLTAMTRGEVDCGRGPMKEWLTEAFFFCTFDVEGTALSAGTFPTGRM